MNFFKNVIKVIISIIGIIKLIFQVLISKILNQPKCVLISNGFSMSGAPVVLFEVANIYKQNGYDIYIFSKHFGKLTNECRKNNYKFVIIPFFESIAKYLYLRMNANFYFVNTIVNFSWIDILAKKDRRVFWWLHEGTFYIDEYINKLRKIKYYEKVRIFAVSPWTIKVLKKKNINWNIELLFYGCEDFYKFDENGKKSEMFNILIVGNICPRKNQIYLINQIKQLDNINNIKLTIVGSKLNGENKYYEEFLKLIKNSNIKYFPYISHNDIHKYYENADLIVCTSIDDPMPVFITEGLMFKKIILTSNNTGQFEIIKNGINGFVYDNDNEKNFKERLVEIINLSNEEKNIICNNARLTYEKYFDLKNFNKTLIKKTITNN